MPSAKVAYSDSNLRISFWQNVAIVDVAGEVDVVRMQAIERSYRVLLVQYPRGIVSLTMLRRGTPVATAEARAVSVRFVRALGSSLLRVAIVIESKGVVAQMLTAVIRGINVMSRNAKLSVSGSLDEAVRAAAACAVPASATANVEAELRAVVDEARAAFQPAMAASA